MTDVRVTVEVGDKGTVRATYSDDERRSEYELPAVGYGGTDADLVRLFERWLGLRDRTWEEAEIRAFGSLLHRCLFGVDGYQAIERITREAAPSVVHLELAFPAEGPFARMAAVPWEFLYRPDRRGGEGSYLAADDRMVLSRYIPLDAKQPSYEPTSDPYILVVVSQPDSRRLGPVMYEDVLAGIERCPPRGFPVRVLHQPTAETLAAAVAGPGQLQLLHFMGHGSFDVQAGQASLALVDSYGGEHWVGDRVLAGILTRGGRAPRAVILHACEGGRVDFPASFAGLAPQLVRRGVNSVVAMQYPVTNSTAIAFSTYLYEQLSHDVELDVATQQARWQISQVAGPDGGPPDPRLIGLPVVYRQGRGPLFGPPVELAAETHAATHAQPPPVASAEAGGQR